MRHTRKRQLYNFQKKRNVVFVNFEMNHWNSIEDSLDKSFKWHREYNNVSYSEKIFGKEYITAYVDLYRKDSIYF